MALPTFKPELRTVIPRRITRSQEQRRYYGRNVDLAAIEAAVHAATVGLMADMTDLSTEAMGVDPHLSSVLGKRFGALLVASRRVKPASGAGIDKNMALQAARSIEAAFARCATMPQAIFDTAWALFDGRAAHEVHWGSCAGIGEGPFRIRWAPEELAWVHPRLVSFGRERELRYIDPNRAQGNFSSTDGFAFRDIPFKFLTWTPRLFREYPEREGLAPRCNYWSFFKRFSWRHRMLLTEIFGVPWRIVSAVDMSVGWDQLAAAADAAEALGAETTAQLDPGVKMEVVHPDGNTGALFQMTSADVDAQLSKLIVGQGGTTDGAPSGMNSDQTRVMKDEQIMIAMRDCLGLGPVWTEFARWIATLNWGEEAAALYTPSVEFDASPQRDRKADLDVISQVVSMRVPVPVDEARSAAGLRAPEPGEPVLEPPAAPVDPFGLPPSGLGAPTRQITEPTTNARGTHDHGSGEHICAECGRAAPRFGGW